jgi:4-aminobutyrate aminotransferase/(S)-3-amino-2-methylpropionate transaminase
MVAMEFVRDRASKTPAPGHTRYVIRRAMEEGVLLLKAGVYGSVIRTLAPLVITDEQLADALDVIHRAVAGAREHPLADLPEAKGTRGV